MKKTDRLLIITILMLLFCASCAKNPYYDDALFYMDSKSYTKASTEFGRAIMVEPLRIDIRVLLAKSLKLANRKEQSLKAYITVLNLDPKNKIAINEIAIFLKKSFNEASEHTKKAEYTEAFNKYEKILDVDSTNKEAIAKMNNLADFFLEEGNKHFKNDDKDAAVKNYSQYLRINPYNQPLIENYAKLSTYYTDKAVNIESSDSYTAIDHYENALSIDKFNDSLHFKVGKLFAYFNEFKDSAFLAFKEAVVINPHASKYHFHLASHYLKHYNYANAKIEYKRSVQLLKRELKNSTLSKKKYKYFYDSITALKPTKKGLLESKDKEVYVQLPNEEKINISFTDEQIQTLKKAIKLSTKIGEFYTRLIDIKENDSGIEDGESYDKREMFKNIELLENLIAEDKEDLDKEKKIFSSLQNKIKNYDKELEEILTEIGKIIETI